MTQPSYPLKLPASIKATAARLAKEDGVSLNQWITVAVAQKIGATETAAAFLKRRAGDARPEDLKRFLARCPGRRPRARERNHRARSRTARHSSSTPARIVRTVRGAPARKRSQKPIATPAERAR